MLYFYVTRVLSVPFRVVLCGQSIVSRTWHFRLFFAGMTALGTTFVKMRSFLNLN